MYNGNKPNIFYGMAYILNSYFEFNTFLHVYVAVILFYLTTYLRIYRN